MKKIKKLLILTLCLKLSGIDALATNITETVDPRKLEEELVRNMQAQQQPHNNREIAGCFAIDEIDQNNHNYEDIEALSNLQKNNTTNANHSNTDGNQDDNATTSIEGANIVTNSHLFVNENKEENEEENEAPQQNTSRKSATKEKFKSLKIVRLLGNTALFVAGTVVVLSPLAMEIFMTAETSEIVKLKTNNATAFGSRLEKFYYNEYEKKTNIDDKSNSSSYLINNLEYAYYMANLAAFKLTGVLLGNSANIALNPIRNYINTTIGAYIPTPIAEIASTASKYTTYLLSNIAIGEYARTLGIMPQFIRAELITKNECKQIGPRERNVAGGDDEWCETIQVKPYERAKSISIFLMIMRLFIAGYIGKKFVTNNFEDGEDLLFEAIASELIVDIFFAFASGSLSRSFFLDRKYVCEKSFESNYEWFEKDCNKNGIDNCCSLFAEKLGITAINTKALSLTSALGSAWVFLLTATAMIAEYIFCYSDDDEEETTSTESNETTKEKEKEEELTNNPTPSSSSTASQA